MQLFKIIAPYAMLAVCFALLNARLHLPPLSLFLVALTLTDGASPLAPNFDSRILFRARWLMSVFCSGTVMTITFFLNVTDTGSWLEIGQTISFFCISSLLLVWSAGICVVGEVLMAGQPRGRSIHQSRKTE